MTETACSGGSDVLDRPLAILDPLAVVQPLANGRPFGFLAGPLRHLAPAVVPAAPSVRNGDRFERRRHRRQDRLIDEA